MKLVMLAAGGTGGHLFPAQALAEELVERGYDIHLLTDERVRDYGKAFPASKTHIVPSASLSFSDPLGMPGKFLRLAGGFWRARAILREYRPNAVVGFGGYPSLPPMLAAISVGIPSIVHEQNSVLGRANRLLANRVTAIATSFETIFGLPELAKQKTVFTGNPVRSVVLEVAGTPYPEVPKNGEVRLLVFGGSQGAKFFSDVTPSAFALLQPNILKCLKVVQQCRQEDIDRVEAAYADLGVSCEIRTFFPNLPELMRDSHLIICRSGASSIAELGVVGRPAILVPLPHAIDNDQLRNAESFERAGAGFLFPQSTLDAATFASALTRLLCDGEMLKEASKCALRHGRPDAAKRLADLVELKIAAS